MKSHSFPIIEDELALVGEYLDRYIGQELGVMGEVLTRVSLDGKMLRPTLLLLAGKLVHSHDYPDTDKLCRLAALLELVHLASLIHDDIVDDSPIRRGKRTIQYGFGKDIAVYTGDYILARIVYHLLHEGHNVSGTYLAKAVEDMCRGEVEQYKYRYDPNTPIEAYLENIKNKTASMFVAAFEIASHESGYEADLAALLRDIGLHMGMAFQLRDDLLDFTSGTEDGKPTHRDFRDGIYTLPVLYTIAQGGEASNTLRMLAGVSPHSDTDIARMQNLVEGGILYTRTRIAAHIQAIRNILVSIPPSPAHQALSDITSWLAQDIV